MELLINNCTVTENKRTSNFPGTIVTVVSWVLNNSSAYKILLFMCELVTIDSTLLDIC